MCIFLCPFPSTQLSPQVLVQPKTDLPPLALSFLSCAIVLAETSHSPLDNVLAYYRSGSTIADNDMLL